VAVTTIEKIAYHLGRRDEVPNQELAAELARERNRAGIDEIAAGLNDKNPSIQSDCLKVLYEIGYLNTELISGYVQTFLDLLDSKNNRMVWGAMIAISTIAELVPDEIMPNLERIKHLIETGTVITNVSGVKTLINLSKAGDRYYDALIADLLDLQKRCRDVDFAKRAEDMLPVIRPAHREAFKAILVERKPSLSSAAQKRLQTVINRLG
jgi:uncharacterized protein (DUF4213/DUF364 family)